VVFSAKSRIILVVEDDAAVRELYRSALSREGYSVIAVEDGLDALRVIEGAVLPTAVVLDLGLPRLDGRDVYREMKARADTKLIPILIVTGNDASDLNPADFACILHKPVALETLMDAVRHCIKRSSRQIT
jgi:DNA-binding response OmpR family regulator